MRNFLQKKYNKNRLESTKHCPSQSTTFFQIWKNHNLLIGLVKAIIWFYNFKKSKQNLSLAWFRVPCDLLGCAMVSMNFTQWFIFLVIAEYLMLTAGESGGTVEEHRYEA